MTTPRTDNDLERAVLAYLAEHPRAMDSLVGIAEWWLERERIRSEILAVSRVVNALVERGLLQRIGTGESALYCLNTTIPSVPKGDPR